VAKAKSERLIEVVASIHSKDRPASPFGGRRLRGFQHHRLRHTCQRQIAEDFEPLAGTLHRGRLEGHRREFLNVEEIGPLYVFVTIGALGIDGCGIQNGFNAVFAWIFRVPSDRTFNIANRTTYISDRHVLDDEGRLRVIGIDGPR
jgi:hypothetical protein